MAIDSRIALGYQPAQFESPVNQLAKVLQVKGMQDEQAMNRLKMDEYQRGVDDQNALRSALSQPGADPYKVLLQRGNVKGAMDWQKGQADVGRVNAEADAKKLEMAHKRVEMVGQGFGWLRQNPSVENARMLIQGLEQQQIAPPAMAQQLLAQIEANPTPENISRLATMSFQQALATKEQLPKFQTNNIGGQTVTQAIDPVTGQARVSSAMQNTQSPDSAASVAATLRGQNLTDALARERLAFDKAQPKGVLDPERGLLVDPRSGEARPVTMNGQPVAPKLSEGVKKELMGISQQRSIIDGAIQAVKGTPSAFSLTRGAATMAGAIPESLAGRMDSDAERQARSYVFNNVSKVINERAGAAQSAQELARLRSFLPAETDNSDQIVSKLNAFNKYLADMEAGTRGKPGGATGGWSIQRVQ